MNINQNKMEKLLNRILFKKIEKKIKRQSIWLSFSIYKLLVHNHILEQIYGFIFKNTKNLIYCISNK